MLCISSFLCYDRKFVCGPGIKFGILVFLCGCDFVVVLLKFVLVCCFELFILVLAERNCTGFFFMRMLCFNIVCI